MGEVLQPATAQDIAALIADACATGSTLEVVAGGSRRGYGHRVLADAVLDVSALAGVIDYQPEELVLTAGPGTPMAEVRALLERHGQALAFEPPDLAPLWGGSSGAGTLGGCVAVGLSGPRRVHAGAARDHLLGFSAVNGRGERFAAGGKVLKNVTGFDLPKLLTGSLGTLAVLTEVTMKVLPAAPDTVTLEVSGLDVASAIVVMRRALTGGVAVTGAAHLPEHGGRTLLRLEGTTAALSAQARDLERRLGDLAVRVLRLGAAESLPLWADIGAAAGLRAGERDWVWRIALPAGSAASVLQHLGMLPGLRWQLDWGGALLWICHAQPVDDCPTDVRAALAGIEGAHATLMRGPTDGAVGSGLPVFQPLPRPLASLAARVAAAFDPRGVLNPGRMGPLHRAQET